jgi:hypothetical protein
MLFVRAADEGKSAVERFPTAKVVGDIYVLADRLMRSLGEDRNPRRSDFFGRSIVDVFRGLFERIATQFG